MWGFVRILERSTSLRGLGDVYKRQVWYNYRRIPAVTLAKRLVDEGRLGKIFHYRAKFLQDLSLIHI